MTETQVTEPKVPVGVMSNTPEEAEKLFEGATVDPVEVSRTMLELDPSDIVIDESRNMRRYAVSAKAINDLANDIIGNGQLQPVMVRREGGKYVLVFGFSRVRAIQHINETTKEKRKVLALNAGASMTDLESFSANVAENLKRQDLSPIDQVHIIKVFTDGGMSKRDVSKLLGRAASWVTQHAQIGELRPKIQKMIHEGKIPYTYAVEIAGMSEEEQDKSVEELEKSGGTIDAREKLRKAKKVSKAKKKGQDVSIALTLREARKELESMAGVGLEEGVECKFSDTAQTVAGAVLKFLDGKLGIRALANKIDSL